MTDNIIPNIFDQPKYNEIIVRNIPRIRRIKEAVENNIGYYVDHVVINDKILDEETISIVMTTHNRIVQTLFTLDTIAASLYKNIQVILVDDSTNGFIDTGSFKKYPYQIDYLMIKNRDWINPCVNYNIGFKYVKGSYVIIQNAEVCHVGDVMKFVRENTTEGKYLVFDVINARSYLNNRLVYSLFAYNRFDLVHLEKIMKNNRMVWYQHCHYRPANLHFLTAMHISDFQKLDGFDYDFAMGTDFDDGDLIFRIMHILRLKIVNVQFQNEKLMGIHQHHDKASKNISKKLYQKYSELNKYLYLKKIRYYGINKSWIKIY